jgi:hypothetical protein
LESGLNDAVLLPVLIVAMAFLGEHAALTGTDWARLGLDLLVLGPGAGVAVGLVAVATLDLIRRRLGVRRDYESVYSLGVAFAAYAAAEAVHGSGFLAAFAAGLTIVALDVELCDCFLDYGGATSEMALLFTFVLFGSSLIWSGLTVLSWETLAFAVIVLLVRPPAFLVSLARSGVDRYDRLMIAWFGPRGLSSLLLVLLPVFAGIPGSEKLFSIACLVVLMSVVVHGGSPMFLGRGARRRALLSETPASGNDPGEIARPSDAVLDPTPAGGVNHHPTDGALPPSTPDTVGIKAFLSDDPVSTSAPESAGDDLLATTQGPSLTIAALRRLWQSGEKVIILDVRTDRSYDPSPWQASGAIRLSPDNVAARAAELALPRHSWIVAYCA